MIHKFAKMVAYRRGRAAESRLISASSGDTVSLLTVRAKGVRSAKGSNKNGIGAKTREHGRQTDVSKTALHTFVLPRQLLYHQVCPADALSVAVYR